MGDLDELAAYNTAAAAYQLSVAVTSGEKQKIPKISILLLSFHHH
jgi:hypothetical protein